MIPNEDEKRNDQLYKFLDAQECDEDDYPEPTDNDMEQAKEYVQQCIADDPHSLMNEAVNLAYESFLSWVPLIGTTEGESAKQEFLHCLAKDMEAIAHERIEERAKDLARGDAI